MAQKYVGVDLGTETVKVVVTAAGLRGVNVLDVIEEPVFHDETNGGPMDAAVSTALDVLRSRGLMDEAVGVAVPGGLASYRLLTFPFSDARRIGQAVPFEAEGQFPAALEQLQYDHVEASSPVGGGRALVVAAARQAIEQIASAFKSAGVDLKLVTTTGIAIAQVARGPIPRLTGDGAESPVHPLQLVVDIGARTTEIVAVGEKGPVAVRSLRRGGSDVTAAIAKAFEMDMGAAETAKHRDGFLPHHGLTEMTSEQMEAGKIVATAVERLIREIEHTRIWLRSEYDYEVTQIRLAGAGARLSGLADYVAEQIDLPVAPIVLHGAAVRDAAGRDWTTTCAALGAAVATARRPLIQLYDVTVGEGDASWLQERLSTLAGIGVAIMAFGALDTIAQVKALEAEQEARTAELASATEAVFGKPITSVDEIEARFAAVEGQDLASLVPHRGALDVLAMIGTAAAPHDAQAQPQPTDAGEDDTGENGEGGEPPPATAPAGVPPVIQLGAPVGQPEEGADGTASVLPPITDPTKIFRDDELVFSMVDIRERKVEMKVSATRSSAQDRLAIRLGELGCLRNIQKGKVRDQNERKVFEMHMDNACYVDTGVGEGGS